MAPEKWRRAEVPKDAEDGGGDEDERRGSPEEYGRSYQVDSRGQAIGGELPFDGIELSRLRPKRVHEGVVVAISKSGEIQTNFPLS